MHRWNEILSSPLLRHFDPVSSVAFPNMHKIDTFQGENIWYECGCVVIARKLVHLGIRAVEISELSWLDRAAWQCPPGFRASSIKLKSIFDREAKCRSFLWLQWHVSSYTCRCLINFQPTLTEIVILSSFPDIKGHFLIIRGTTNIHLSKH